MTLVADVLALVVLLAVVVVLAQPETASTTNAAMNNRRGVTLGTRASSARAGLSPMDDTTVDRYLPRMITDRVAPVLESVEKIASVIEGDAAEAERTGRLTAPVFDAVCDAGLFRMLVPADLGGFGLNIPESLAVVERVAACDASTAWVLSILAGSAMFARFLAREAFTTICGDPLGFAAGSLNPAGARAEQVDGGFVFSGKASYLSGALHAKWAMATAFVTRNGEPLIDGGMQIRTGVFPLEHARCLDTWHVTGMRATGSSDYEFEGVEVSEAWTFEPLKPRTGVASDPFAAIPLWAQLGGGLAACAVGAARNMLDRFGTLASAKVPAGGFSALAERAPAQMAFAEADGLYQAARAVLMDATIDTWERGVANAPFDNEVLAHKRVATVTAVRLAAQAIDLLHDAAGMNAVAADSVLDRCWRDVHTITQHVILGPARFETAGRALLGLDPGGPLI